MRLEKPSNRPQKLRNQRLPRIQARPLDGKYIRIGPITLNKGPF